MTMILHEQVMFPVKPIPGNDGWYQISGAPKALGYGDIGDWLQDEVCGGSPSVIVEDARLAGIHDHPDLPSEDPRFNHRAFVALNSHDGDYQSEPDFVIVKQKDGTLLCAMLVNAPEWVLFKYIFEMMYQDKSDWQGVGGEWKQMDKKRAVAYEKDVAEILQHNRVRLDKEDAEWAVKQAEYNARMLQVKKDAEADAAKKAAAKKTAAKKKPATKKK